MGFNVGKFLKKATGIEGVKKAYGSISGQDAAKEQAKAGQNALALQQQMYEQGRTDLSPYRNFGANSLTDMQSWLSGPNGTFKAPSMEDVKNTPGYQFGLNQGVDTVQNNAAARGGLLSGNALRAVNEYGQDYASGKYSDYYNRAVQEYQNELNKRMGFVNLGYGAAGGSAGLSQNFGQVGGQTMQNIGDAKANAANAFGNVFWKGLDTAAKFYNSKPGG